MKLVDRAPIEFKEKNELNWYLHKQPEGVWDPVYLYRSIKESSVYYHSREFSEHNTVVGYIAFEKEDFCRFNEDFVKLVNGEIDDSSSLYYELVNLAPSETHGEGQWKGYPLPLLFKKDSPDYHSDEVVKARDRVLRDLRKLDFPV